MQRPLKIAEHRLCCISVAGEEMNVDFIGIEPGNAAARKAAQGAIPEIAKPPNVDSPALAPCPLDRHIDRSRKRRAGICPINRMNVIPPRSAAPVPEPLADTELWGEFCSDGETLNQHKNKDRTKCRARQAFPSCISNTRS